MSVVQDDNKTVSTASHDVVLTIAGSDPCAGAGMQADLKTISAMGGYAVTVVSALTVQNTLGVSAVHPVPADVVAAQMEAVMSDVGADAVKIGMLPNAQVMHAVAECLRRWPVAHVVIDPVMISTSGHALMSPDAVQCFVRELLPLATVVTPNAPEAAALTGQAVSSLSEMLSAARRLSAMAGEGDGPSAGRGLSVLLKGGHVAADADGFLTDVLFDAATGEFHYLRAPLVASRNTHGTGCTLSSALATALAHGQSLPDAARSAHHFLQRALQAAVPLTFGHGHGGLHHFFSPS